MTVIFYLVAIFFFALLIGFAGKVIIGGLMGAKPEMFRFARKGSIGNQLFNTIYLVFISLLVSIPLGVCAGIYLAMYAKQGKMTKFLRMCIETLSSLPSIVVGLFGYLVFLVFFGMGKSLMAGALSKIPDSTIEAARDAGAERFRILRQMILPLTYRDLFVAATFVFMSNISSFTTPYLMDGNNPQMMGISLYTQFNNGHYEKAAALSVIMFLFSVLSAAVYVYTNMKENEWEKGNG